jgi:hypothetical protein
MDDETQPRASGTSLFGLVAAGIIVAGGLLRLAASLDQPWMDEVWSIANALRVRSPIQILTSLTLDNNHPLNTLWLWLVGSTTRWWLYRALAVTSGLLTLVVTARVRPRPPGPEGLVRLALTSLSFPLVLLGSEARGYAPAMLCGLVAYLLLQGDDRPSPARRLALTTVLVTGMLAHPTTLYIVVALGVWAFVRARAGGARLIAAAGRAAVLLAPAVAITALLLSVYVWRFKIGGAPALGPPILFQWLTLTIGAPREGAPALVGAGVAVLILGGGLFLAWRKRDEDWAFLLVATLLPPLMQLVVNPNVAMARYLLIPLPLMFVVLARTLVRVGRAGTPGRWLAGVAVVAILAGNLVQIERLLRITRGHYVEAIAFMMEHGSRPEVSIGSYHDYLMVLEFYARKVPRPRPVRYEPLALDTPPERLPEFFLIHSFDREPDAEATVTIHGGRYDLAFVAPYLGELSGFHWLVYRQAPPPTPPGVTSGRGR